ncbi:putative synaptonemal complex protein 1-like [Sesbania bispinosa]|nr:putative synaptonemal complex protein 1-like [Sesbania bispinosa]
MLHSYFYGSILLSVSIFAMQELGFPISKSLDQFKSFYGLTSGTTKIIIALFPSFHRFRCIGKFRESETHNKGVGEGSFSRSAKPVEFTVEIDWTLHP